MLTITLTTEEAESLADLLRDAAIPNVERRISLLTGIDDNVIVILQAELERRRSVLAKLEAGRDG